MPQLVFLITAREKILSGILDEHLDLSYQTNMVELPQEIRYCTNMTSLDLSNNGLQTVPSELFSITRLVKLNLSNNLLTDVNGIEQLVRNNTNHFFLKTKTKTNKS
jgi:Leucine-rich repeat (LRR) protein